MTNVQDERLSVIHLLRAGQAVADVAQQLGHSERWVRKWYARYRQGGWSAVQAQSRAPKQHGRRISATVRQLVVQVRSELEAEAAGGGLKYIGARAVRTRLKQRLRADVPSVASIERILHASGLTRQPKPAEPEVHYPHLHPTQPHQLGQIDIVPHYLTGGQKVACFNGLDVVSRYPTGQAYAKARSQEAVAFCLHFWQTLGIPTYTQVDNQDCFSGGHTHPYVLGKVVRLALTVGTELVFSPVYHPQSNGYVERFHREYDRHVWQDTYLVDLAAIDAQASRFFVAYRHSRHHSGLAEQTPHEVHARVPPQHLSAAFALPTERLPLAAGQVHFIRRLQADGTISVLNVNWLVPHADPQHGVWATLELTPTGATLRVYDAAPDAAERRCLVSHPFPLSEAVQQRSPLAPRLNPQPTPARLPTASRPLLPVAATAVGVMLLAAILSTRRAGGTMY